MALYYHQGELTYVPTILKSNSLLLHYCCVLKDWAFFPHSALETPAVFPCKNGTVCSWDTQAECQLEQSPRCSESLELRHLWSKALWMDGCISPDLLLRATLSRCILYSTHGKTQNKTARSQRVMSTPHTGVDSCVITQRLRLFSKLQKSWQ